MAGLTPVSNVAAWWCSLADWLGDLSRDVRHAARGLRRSPAFTLAVVVMLGLGSGAATAVFGVVYGLLVRPLPYSGADRIVRVGLARVGQSGVGPMYRRVFESLRGTSEAFEQVAGHAPKSLAWVGPEGSVLLRGAAVTPSLFPLLRVVLHAGRPFGAAEGRFGADRVVVLSYASWTRRFGSDADIVGAPLSLGGAPYTVVGVLAQGFSFPGPEVEFWTPMVLGSPNRGLDRLVATFSGLGRLRRGVSSNQAAAEVDTILRRSGIFASSLEARVIPLQAALTAEYRPALVALSAAVALLLALVAVNVAGLLLARLFTRYQDLAICGALGASPGRIVRGLLVESVLLSVAGGAVGLAAAAGLLRIGATLVPPALSRLAAGTDDGSVLAFAAVLSVGVGLLAGAGPALQWLRRGLVRPLDGAEKPAFGGGAVPEVNRARAGLVVVQVGLALVLLVGAGLLLNSFVRLATIDPGYDADNVLTARVGYPDLPGLLFDGITAAQIGARFDGKRRFYEALADRLARLEHLAGVEAVGLSSFVPLAGQPMRTFPFHVAGGPAPLQRPPQARVILASPGYFAALRPHLRGGRVFTARDPAGSPRVAVVSETLAREVLGSRAVGQRLLLMPGTSGVHTVEVIGVVADVTVPGLAGTESPADVYVSTLQPGFFSNPDELFVTIRTARDPAAMIPFLREALAEVHPRAVPEDMLTMSGRFAVTVAEPRLYAAGAGLFAALALVLAASGLYGLVNYTVRRRRRELGVRLALGAQSGDVLRLVLWRAGVLTAVGIVLGLPAGVAATRILESVLFGVTPMDMPTVGAVTLVVVGVALVAAYLPARQATRIDPMDVLRTE